MKHIISSWTLHHKQSNLFKVLLDWDITLHNREAVNTDLDYRVRLV